MGVGDAGKSVASEPKADVSLQALTARLRLLRAYCDGKLSVEDVERETKRIESSH